MQFGEDCESAPSTGDRPMGSKCESIARDRTGSGMGSAPILFRFAVRLRLAPPFPGLVLLVEIVPPAGDLAIRLTTTGGHDRLSKLLGAINRDHVEARRRMELGKAIVDAARGEEYGQVPGWWYDFDKQYQAGEWRRQPQADGNAEEDWR